MKKIIKLTTVVKALETEVLKAGQWFHYQGDDKKQYKTCKVCAVGAVLRQCSVLTYALKEGISPSNIANRAIRIGSLSDYEISSEATWADINNLLNAKLYLGALSAFFESTMKYERTNTPTKRVRKLLVSFVKRTFAKQFEVTI